MHRTRRVALTVAAAAGLIGGAGATIAAVGQSTSGMAVITPASHGARTADTTAEAVADAQRQALEDYVSEMQGRVDALAGKARDARRHLTRAEARHARLIALARARAAAYDRAAATAAAQAAAAPPQQSAAMPATDTTTGASGSGGTGDDEHEHEGGDDD